MELLVSIIKRYEKFPAQDNISFPNIWTTDTAPTGE
jgi:hypothetical protein